MVDTTDLKSVARTSMRVQVPPLLPPKKHEDYYDEVRKTFDLSGDLEVFIYTYKGELINIKSRWR
jgi:hypothetical protein